MRYGKSIEERLAGFAQRQAEREARRKRYLTPRNPHPRYRRAGEIVSVPAGDLMCATIHDGNTSPKILSPNKWTLEGREALAK